MHQSILALHNIVRWVVLILGIIAFVRALIGWLGKRDWVESDRKAGSFFTIAIDIQLLLGLALFLFFSPITRAAFQDFSAVMKIDDLRFFTIEHTFFMVLAIVFAHVGNAITKKDIADASKFKRAALFYGLALLLILLGMPWVRPLLPGLG